MSKTLIRRGAPVRRSRNREVDQGLICETAVVTLSKRMVVRVRWSYRPGAAWPPRRSAKAKSPSPGVAYATATNEQVLTRADATFGDGAEAYAAYEAARRGARPVDVLIDLNTDERVRKPTLPFAERDGDFAFAERRGGRLIDRSPTIQPGLFGSWRARACGGATFAVIRSCCFPPFPAFPESDYPRLLPGRCDGLAVEVSHLHSVA
ncbi:hypothetical protein [Streptomyces sp. NPDC056491]|uniref:hypothetical protein n=1 Tax=Streptomyces sp. NPDC056491 TaxID=3345837 RepID=UPI003675BC23